MVQCCVPFCKSTPGPSNNYSFHEFPVTKVRFEWLRRIARKANGTGNKPWCPSDRSKVCSLHFREEDFRRDLKKRRLLPNAVPSIFPGYPPEMQQARRLSSPQMGDAPKVLETNSAIDKRIARPRRGRKRKWLASGSLTDNTEVTGEVSSTVSENMAAAASLTATRRLKRGRASEQKARCRVAHANVAGSSEPVQELPTVSATTGQHIQSFSSTSTPVSRTQKPITGDSTSKLVIHSIRSLQKSPVLFASSVDAATSSCAVEGPLVSSTQLENKGGTVTAACGEASTVTVLDSVSKTAAATEVVEDASSNTRTLVPSSSDAATSSCSQSPSTTDLQVSRFASPQAGVVLSINPSFGEMVPRGEPSQLDVTAGSAPSSQAVVASVSTPPTPAPPRLAAESGTLLVRLANSSTATTASCKQKLVAVVPSGIKPEALKQLLLSSKLLSKTVVSGSANLLTNRSTNASESKIVTMCASGTTADMVRAVQSKTPKHRVKARRVVNVRGSSSDVTRVVEQVDCLGKSRHTVTPHSTPARRSKSPSQLLIPDSPVTASQHEVGTKLPMRRTVGSQTLLNRQRLRHLCQRLKTLQRKCLKLQTHKQHLQQELSTARLEAKRAQTIVKELRLTQFQERVASGDARCLFLEEQLRCLGQTKHRWREETLQCCLLWNTLSPRGYRLISQSGLLSLPSCSTLKRHIGAVGNSTASNREPPSPTGDTLPSMEDIDDIHQLPDIVDVHVMEPSTDEVSDYASEVSVHSDTDDTARVDVSSETTVQDGSVANASPDLQAERSQCSTKDAASIVCPESGRKLKSVRDSQTRKKSLTRHFARVLAGNPTPQEGEQVLQVVYTKPSDILDDLPGVDSATPGAGDTTAAPESADELVEKSVVHKACGDCNNADQTDCFEPTAELMAPSKWLTRATDKPSDCAQFLTTQTKKKNAERSASTRNRPRQLMVRSNVPRPKPSRTKLVSLKVRKDVSATGCSGHLHQASNSSCTESTSAAVKMKVFLSEDNLQEELASPPKDLAELLNIVGADTSSERTVSAIDASSSARDTVANSETQKLSLQETNSPKDAVEPCVLSTVTGSPINVAGVFPGDDEQVLNVIYAEPSTSEGEVFCGESTADENQVFQILYVCTPENLEAGQ
ncbi:mucin-17 [Rhipicephalus sanguineus]|uniref:mucin-17 n=1 Tax=Rhipicephalus sanguineus TaxID=34632 RepID=UPI001892F2A1|nr:mucin-17 [Rhipicephalus sanguineus]